MPGIEYYIDIFKNDTNIQQNIWYLLQGYNDIRGNIKTFDTRLVWYLISVFIPILIPGADLYTSPTLVQTSKLHNDFFLASIHSFINKVTGLYIQGPDLCRETLQIDHVLRKVY
jgi:hypothetical protein